MCAIAGVFGADDMTAAQKGVAAMLATMRSRGPDDTGVESDENAGLVLGHNRLSIIDPGLGGHQPMVNPETGDTLVFNGEIYNFRELRDALSAKGVRFRSRSDTEVLLHAFAAWGFDCLARLRGMYAFAIWRPHEGVLYLARDPMGIKPLYYRPGPKGGIAFASEIKALCALPESDAVVDRTALGQFLEFGYTFENERTIFRGVRKLPPGAALVLRKGATPKLIRHFEPNLEANSTRSKTEAGDDLFETLTQVVAEHLVADVPVGLLLSGGLDSSVIAALAARTASISTLTMAFEGSEVDERDHARRVAEFIGAKHDSIIISSDELRESVHDSAAVFDDIFADWGTISTRLLYKKARERGLKVVLVGEGADELFGGYDVFRASGSRAPTEIWLFQLYRAYAGRRYGRHYSAFRRIMLGHLRDASGDRFAALRLFETRNQLPNNYVMKVDKASMSVGVEARTPYLDQRVAEIAYRVGADALLAPQSEKRLLRDMARRHRLLPPECVERRKFGAAVASSWLDDSTRFRAFARDVVLAPGGWTEALGLKSAMEDYFIRNRAGWRFPQAISIFRNLAWRLLLLELWSRAMGVTARGD